MILFCSIDSFLFFPLCNQQLSQFIAINVIFVVSFTVHTTIIPHIIYFRAILVFCVTPHQANRNFLVEFVKSWNTLASLTTIKLALLSLPMCAGKRF